MSDMRSEEEQLDAIKRWWKENGTSLVVGVVVAAAGVFGWKAWQQYQLGQSEAASQRYQELLSLNSQSNLDAATRQRADALIGELKEHHDSTLYADLGRLIEVRLAVQADDTTSAVDALEALVSTSEHDYVQGLARLRLARLQLAEADADAAIATLKSGVPASLAAIQAELRGDAHLALNQRDQAAVAWREALELAAQGGQSQYGIRLKLDDLGIEETS